MYHTPINTLAIPYRVIFYYANRDVGFTPKNVEYALMVCGLEVEVTETEVGSKQVTINVTMNPVLTTNSL